MGKRNNNGNNLLNGAIHLHTKYSHDGSMNPEELAFFLKSKGYDFIIITEHSYDMDDKTSASLEEEAAKLSTPTFLVIASLEFRCHHDIDILGLGVTAICNYDDPLKVIEHIHKNGGIAVLAHPNAMDYPLEDKWVKKLDGCEIYNNSKDGKFMAQPKSIRMFEKLKMWNPRLLAYAGLDLHRKESFKFVSIQTSGIELTRDSIFRCLRNGEYRNYSLFFRVNSRGEVNYIQFVYVFIVRSALNIIRTLRSFVSR